MVTTEQIKLLVSEIIEGMDLFMVDVTVKPGNRIAVYVDKLEGITIDECAELSREIEKRMDRETEDFELEVSSPGLSQPFKVKQQYFKNIGKEVEIVLITGEKLIATLQGMNDNEITITYTQKIKKDGKGKPELVEQKKAILYADIKSTKVFINF